jgi:hypothetical protein
MLGDGHDFRKLFFAGPTQKIVLGHGSLPIAGRPISGGLSFLALEAEVRPRHRFDARLRDRLLTDRACAERSLSDPIERLFDRLQETTVALMQANLKVRFCIGICLVDEIAL